MAIFSANIANNGNKLVTPLGSQTSIIEEFVLQSSEVVVGTTVDTLVNSARKSTKNFSLLTISPSNTKIPSAQQERSPHLL